MGRKTKLPSGPGSTVFYGLAGICTMLEAIAIIAQAIFLARAISFLFFGAAFTTILTDFIAFFIVFIIRILFAKGKQHLAERFAHEFGKVKSEQLMQAYFRKNSSIMENGATGQFVTLAIEGIGQMKTYIEIAIPRMISMAIVPLLIVIYVFTVDAISAWILIASVPIVVIFMILLGVAAQKLADSQYETYRVLANHFTDSLKGLATLTFLGQSKHHARKIDLVSDQYRKATNRTLRVAFLSSFALDFFTSLAIAFVAVGLGFRLIEGGQELLPALTILILAPEYFLPIRQVGKDFHATLDGQVALEEIERLTEDDGEVLRSTKSTLEWNRKSVLALSTISVIREGKSVLNNISFSWRGSGMIGLVGRSGSGKTTLLNTLGGFLDPSNGMFSINGIERLSLKDSNWLKQIAYIPQHPYIFPTSLKENIRFYEPEATDEAVYEVIEKIGLTSLVKEFTNGIDERIGEGGRILSGGQEQRIAMARALLSERPIILLDEPTAHLDIETEYEIKQLMMRVFKDKLIFLATHRAHWMKDMDYLLVLEGGHLVEQGTHEELFKNRGTYRNLIMGQRRGAD